MSAYQLYLDSELEEAVLLGALTLAEAWQLQDQFLLQQSEVLVLPREWKPLLDRLQLSQMQVPKGVRPQ